MNIQIYRYNKFVDKFSQKKIFIIHTYHSNNIFSGVWYPFEM